MSREAIYEALRAHLETKTAALTVSRRLVPWAQINTVEQPAIFIAEDHEVVDQTYGQEPVWNYHVDLVLYVNAGGDSEMPPSSLLNPIIDQIEAVFALNPNPVQNVQTLGGLVRRAWVSGPIEKDRGELGNQAVAIIPVTLQVV